MLIFRFNYFSLGYYKKWFTYFNAQNKHQFTHNVQCCMSETFWFSSCLFKALPILDTLL